MLRGLTPWCVQLRWSRLSCEAGGRSLLVLPTPKQAGVEHLAPSGWGAPSSPSRRGYCGPGVSPHPATASEPCCLPSPASGVVRFRPLDPSSASKLPSTPTAPTPLHVVLLSEPALASPGSTSRCVDLLRSSPAVLLRLAGSVRNMAKPAPELMHTPIRSGRAAGLSLAGPVLSNPEMSLKRRHVSRG